MELLVIYLFLFFIGSCFGSFFNVCICRIPKNESIVFPSSHCPVCKKKITPYNNIPVFSYIFLKGKCRDCGTKIHWHYLFVEILTGALFVFLFAFLGNRFNLTYFKYLLFFSTAIIVIFIDFFHMIIPDSIDIPLIVIGIILAFLPMSDITWKSSLMGAGIAFTLFFGIGFIYSKIKKMEGLGGGDVKYLTAIGAFFGSPGVFYILFISAVIALIYILAMKIKRSSFIPFGPFLAVASFVYFIIEFSITNGMTGLFMRMYGL